MEDNEDSLMTATPRLQLTASSYRWKAVDYWNDLPGQMRTERKLNTSKSKLKRRMKDKDNEPG